MTFTRSLIPDLSTNSFDGEKDEAFDLSRDARSVAPIVWLIGKVQSGKGSIIWVMTDSMAAEIGSGFKACTRTARVFDFPAEVPILHPDKTHAEDCLQPGQGFEFLGNRFKAGRRDVRKKSFQRLKDNHPGKDGAVAGGQP